MPDDQKRLADGGDPSVVYEGESAEELHQAVSERFSPHRLTVMGDQRVNGRFRCLHEGLLGLYELGYGADVGVHPGELPDFFSIQLPLSGGGTVMVNRAPLASPLSIAGPGDHLSMRWNSQAVNRVLILPVRAVEQGVLARAGDLPAGALRFEHVLDERNTAVRSWIELTRSFGAFAASPLSPRSPLGVRHFENLLIDTLLDAQPHSWSTKTAGRGTAILPSALRRATDFCAEHAHEPISVADIAQAARVSVRTLREGFRTHLDTSPLAYLTGVRLDHAHGDLLAVARGEATGTVTDIACRWGFTHLGRFSARYRTTYGRTPSQTLREGR